jgi:hypothetical protein
MMTSFTLLENTCQLRVSNMPEAIDLQRLLANNPGVDAERLKIYLEAAKRIVRVKGRYRYNIMPPFCRRQRRRARVKGVGVSSIVEVKELGRKT